MLNAEPRGLASIRFGEQGTLRMTFNVTTQGGHDAYTNRNEGAVRIAMHLINRLVGLEGIRGEGMDPELQAYLQMSDVRRVTDDIMSSGAVDSMLKPTVNVGTITGGAKVNMIPGSCKFEVEVRLPIGLEPRGSDCTCQNRRAAGRRPRSLIQRTRTSVQPSCCQFHTP